MHDRKLAVRPLDVKTRTALSLACVVVVAAAAAAPATPAAPAPRYELTALSGTLTQFGPDQGIAPTDSLLARASLSFSILNRPRTVLSRTRRAAALPLRYTGSGMWSLDYYFGRSASSGTCGESVTLAPEALTRARVRLALAPARRVRVSVDVPVISIAPYDCMASIGYVTLTRTYPRATFAQKRFALKVAAKQQADDGGFVTMTWAWKVTLAFRRL